MLLVFDSSILCQDLRFTGTAARVLFGNARVVPVMVAVPEVVVDEVTNHFRERLGKARLTLTDAHKKLSILSLNQLIFLTQRMLSGRQYPSFRFGRLLAYSQDQRNSRIFDWLFKANQPSNSRNHQREMSGQRRFFKRAVFIKYSRCGNNCASATRRSLLRASARFGDHGHSNGHRP